MGVAILCAILREMAEEDDALIRENEEARVAAEYLTARGIEVEA